MTYARQPNTVEDALKRALDHLTGLEIQTYTGLTDDSPLRKASNPMTNINFAFKYGPALEAALVAKGLPPLFEPLFKRMRDDLLRSNGQKIPTDIESRFLDFMAETGGLCGDYRDARDPSSENGREIGKEERAQMEARLCKIIENATALVNDLRDEDNRPQLSLVDAAGASRK